VRWLVPTSGAPPTIAAENEQPGSSGWRLAGRSAQIGGAAVGSIAGYVSDPAPLLGERELVYVNAPGARTVRIQLWRMGWYRGRGGRLYFESGPLPARRQPPCFHSRLTGLTECAWKPTLGFRLPTSLPSGVYILKLVADNHAQVDTVFIARSPKPAKLLVELPDATWEAYNLFGGDDLYPEPGALGVAATASTQGVAVSFDRPYATLSGAGALFVRELAAVRFLERYGYPVSYTTVSALDREPQQVVGAKAVIDVGHSEYWSERAYQALRRFVAEGGSLLLLSSDLFAWRVAFAPAGRNSSQPKAPDRTVFAYKQFVDLAPQPLRSTGLFPGGGGALAGTAFNGCITPRLPGATPTYRYFPWIVAPSAPRWLLRGSGLGPGSTLPGIVGYELDSRSPLAPRDTVLVGYSQPIPCLHGEGGAVSGDLAQTTLYPTSRGGFVFSASTLGWLYGLEPLPGVSPDLPRKPLAGLVAITRNLLARALDRRPRSWSRSRRWRAARTAGGG